MKSFYYSLFYALRGLSIFLHAILGLTKNGADWIN